MKWLFISAVVLIGLVLIGQRVFEARDNRLLRLEMHLSSSGTDATASGSGPRAGGLAGTTADAVVDFEKDTGYCRKTYWTVGQGDTSYPLSRHTISRLLAVAEEVNWQKFKTEFRKKGRDSLPVSTLTVIMSNDTIVVKDYGLVGDAPLHDLYETVYQLGPAKH